MEVVVEDERADADPGRRLRPWPAAAAAATTSQPRGPTSARGRSRLPPRRAPGARSSAAERSGTGTRTGRADRSRAGGGAGHGGLDRSRAGRLTVAMCVITRGAEQRSTGRPGAVWPSRPTTVSATNRAFRTDSSVASTVAANTGDLVVDEEVAPWAKPGANAARGCRWTRRRRCRPNRCRRCCRPGPGRGRRAARPVSWRASSGMSVITSPMQLPPSPRPASACSSSSAAADRPACDAELAAAAEVGEHEHADGAEAVEHPRRRPDAGLELHRDHAGAGADDAFGDRSAGRGGDRLAAVRRP